MSENIYSFAKNRYLFGLDIGKINICLDILVTRCPLKIRGFPAPGKSDISNNSDIFYNSAKMELFKGCFVQGSDIANEPYKIVTADNIILPGWSPSDYNKSFILTVNIDLSGFSYDAALIVPDTKGVK